MKTNAITITRQFGSLGRLIAKRVADKLGYEYYDREIIEKAAEEMGEPVYNLSEYDGHSYTKYGKMMFPLGYGVKNKQKKLFEIEKQVILSLASEKNCVIVGRCSDYILAESNRVNHYSVFIYAPYEARFNYCLKELGLTPEGAEVYIEKVDSARKIFYHEHTGENFESLTYRNTMVDSSFMNQDKVADLICEGARLKFSEE